MAIDPQEMAKAELAEAMIPTPDDIMEELTPLGALYYWEQLGWATLTTWTAHVQDMDDQGDEAASEMAGVLQGIATALGGLDAVCATIGLVPAEAVPQDWDSLAGR